MPADISVVGADDMPFSALTHPPLTTVQIPRVRLGELACDVLLAMIRENAPGSETVLETELIIRESTGMAPFETATSQHGAGHSAERVRPGR